MKSSSLLTALFISSSESMVADASVSGVAGRDSLTLCLVAVFLSAFL